MSDDQPQPSRRSLLGLDAFNVVLADLQTGIGAYLAVFLTGVRHFGPDRIGLAIAAGGLASVVAQIPAGALIDRTRYKRLVVAIAGLIGAVAAPVLAAAAFAIFPPAVGALGLGIVGRVALPTRQGRNQACNGAGNVLFASIEAALGRFISLTATIFAVAGIGEGRAASLQPAFARYRSSNEVQRSLADHAARDSLPIFERDAVRFRARSRLAARHAP